MKERLLCCGTLALVLLVSGSLRLAQAQELTFEDRVRAQEALERVYWSHRTWPQGNPGERPSLRAEVPDSALRARVEDYLRKSNALERLWGRAITADQLQAEMDRMSRNSHDPGMLRELFQALGDDPYLIAECLARPIISDRILRDWYSRDERIHGSLRRRVEGLRAGMADLDAMKWSGGSYAEITWKLSNESSLPSVDDSPAGTVRVNEQDWRREVQRLRDRFPENTPALRRNPPVTLPDSLGSDEASLPIGKPSSVVESDDRFEVRAVMGRERGVIRLATVTWPKESFDEWWRETGPNLPLSIETRAHSYHLRSPVSSPCADDTWRAMGYDAPNPRYSHTAVWTGTEMIVWGGSYWDPTGGRYDPLTDTWTPTSVGPNMPHPGLGATAVWTGSEMIVWGGQIPDMTNTGGRYNPATDSWTPTSLGPGVPAPRIQHSAVWTGTEMVIWGGFRNDSFTVFNSGSRYDPMTDTWRPTSIAANTPSPRRRHTAIWTGSEMIVWGGYGQLDGGRYDPVADTWSTMAPGPPGSPSARDDHTAVWTGHEMIIWGGGDHLQTGGRYDPVTNTWVATSVGTNTAAGRTGHTAVWTGSRMIVYGGYGGPPNFGLLNTGALYYPSTDTWSPLTPGPSGSGRTSHKAVWTGQEMIVWGGSDSYVRLNSGGRYDPVSNTWSPTRIGPSPENRFQNTVVWTGSEMIVWGGQRDNYYYIPLNTGGRYSPATDSWASMSVDSATPSARAYHTAVWTGNQMVVWGGFGGSFPPLDTGGRYDPVLDRWRPTSTGAGAPTRRSGHTAVWTGREMIVWGGGTESGLLKTGGRYDPVADSWRGTSVAPPCPDARSGHSAIWSGRYMVVFGGRPEGPYATNTGGRYDPVSDTWTSTSLGPPTPYPRTTHRSLWTGEKMIVHGGDFTGNLPINSYDPVADTWAEYSAMDAPTYQPGTSVVWTGSEMIVWGGGYDPPYSVNSGGRYSPAMNTWRPTSQALGVPPPRFGQTAVWTGTEMLIWGGIPPTALGGGYCAASSCSITEWFPDSDGDGYGASTAPVLACTQPPGYVSIGGDCNDRDASVITGGIDASCNGFDDDCDGQIDEDFASQPTTCGSGACARTGSTICQGGVLIDTCETPVDTICNGIDDDCDGSIDEDYVPAVSHCGVGLCGRAGTTACIGGAVQPICTPGQPGAEQCDGQDHNCDGVPDSIAVPGAPALLVEKVPGGVARVRWSIAPRAASYDVVKGVLLDLQFSHGNFGFSTQGCIARHSTSGAVVDADLQPPGDGFWYLVRGVNCAGAGTYDSGDPAQVGPRDPGIRLSGGDCP